MRCFSRLLLFITLLFGCTGSTAGDDPRDAAPGRDAAPPPRTDGGPVGSDSGAAGRDSGGPRDGGGPWTVDDVLARVDCGEAGERFPLCGADTNFGIDRWLGTEIEWAHQPGAGPNGRWAVELHHLANASPPDVTEGYFGWRFHGSNGCDVEQGDSCVVRWWFQTVSPEATGDFGSKLFILGDNDGDDGDRIIGTWRHWCEGDCFTFDVDKNIDGIGPHFSGPTPDEWHSVQVVVDSSTTVGSGDGSMSIYLDGDDVDRPTSRVSDLSLVASWNVDFGFGMFRNMREDGAHVRYRIYCVELARSFDPHFRDRTQVACR